MSEIKLKIPKMMCEGCENTIKSSLIKVGYDNLKFDIDNKELVILSEKLDGKKILKTLKKIKFPAEII